MYSNVYDEYLKCFKNFRECEKILQIFYTIVNKQKVEKDL